MTTENKYNYDNPNSHFSGVICPSDFDTTHPGTRDMANRIAKAWDFDEQCRKNEEARNNRMKENKKQ